MLFPDNECAMAGVHEAC